MFTYAPVDCKSISSYEHEATNGVYHGLFLRRPGCRCVVPRCRGGGDDVCVWGGGALVGRGGGYVETHFSFNKHGWPESEIVV